VKLWNAKMEIAIIAPRYGLTGKDADCAELFERVNFHHACP
jgi:hypothetical protein